MFGRLGLLLVGALGLASCFYDDKTLATDGTAATTPSGATSSSGSGGAAPCSAAATYEACVLSDAPVLYFRFEEAVGQACDWRDPSLCIRTKSGNTGTEEQADGLVAGVGATSEGKARKLTAFWGYTHAIDDPIIGKLAFFGREKPWTVELWYRRPNERNGWIFWLHGFGGNEADPPKLMIYPNGPQPTHYNVQFLSEAGEPLRGIEQDLEQDETLHVVIRFDGSDLDLHVNGARTEANEGADNAGAFKSPNQLYVGGFAGSDTCDGAGCWRFTGTLDELAMYDHALADDEILAHYLRGSGQAP